MGWDIESMQISGGKNEIVIDNFALPDLILMNQRCKQSMLSVFEVPKGTVMFLICRAKLPVAWRNKLFPPSMLGLVRDSLEHRALTPSTVVGS